MQTAYDTEQVIYVPLTVHAAMTANDEIYYIVREEAEDIVSLVIPEYGLKEIEGYVVFDRKKSDSYLKKKEVSRRR